MLYARFCALRAEAACVLKSRNGLFIKKGMRFMKQNASFFCEQPASAAAYCLQQFPDTAKATIALADELCRNTFTFREHWEMERTHIPVTFQDEIDWEHIPAGDPEWTYALNRHTSFVVLGKAYLYTGKEEYAACFVRLAKSWLSQSKLCDETKNGSWRSLEAGLRCENWLRAMRMFASSPSVPRAPRAACDTTP